MAGTAPRHGLVDIAISRVLRGAAALGDTADAEWAAAVLAEGTALDPPVRRRWALGGLWFLSGRRRAFRAQQAFALLGLAYVCLFLMAAVTDLRENAPDLLVISNVLILVGAGSLAVAFIIALRWPLRGVLLGVPAVALYATLMVTENRIEAARGFTVAPPPGLAPVPLPDAAVQLLLFVVLLLGVPFLVLVGITISGLFPLSSSLRAEEGLDGATS